MQTAQTGSITALSAVIGRVDPGVVLVFAGGRSFESSGARAACEFALADRSIAYVRDIPENPDLAAIDAAIDVYRDREPDLAIAIGGGSVIDLAKVVVAVAPGSVDARAVVIGDARVPERTIPLVAIPTTSGTGSEATRYSVVTVDGVKTPMGDPALLPSDVILDPELTYSVPPHITASTGLDALSQCMEAMWSVRSDTASHQVATEGLALVLANLDDAVNRPNPTSRTAMMDAAYLSGIAIDTTATTAPHALSYRLTTEHGVPHGHAVALTLGAVLEYNAGVSDADCNDPRGADHVRGSIDAVLGVLGAGDPASGRRQLYDLVEAAGLEPTFAGVGAGSVEAKRAIADAVSPLRLANNPRAFPGDALFEMLRTID